MKPLTVPDSLDAFEGYLEGNGNGRSPVGRKSADNIMRAVRRFAGFAIAHSLRTLKGINQKLCAEWVEHRATEISARTLNGEISYVQKYLTWLATHELAKPITLQLHRARFATDEPVIMEDEQVRRIIQDQADDIDRAVAYLMAATGMRRSEPDRLAVGDFNAAEATLELRAVDVERTKKHARTIPLGPAACAACATLAGGREPTAPLLSSRTATTRIAERHNIIPKRLRQWFCSTICRASVPDYIVKRLMGHMQDRVRKSYDGGYRLSIGRAAMIQVEAVLAAVPAPSTLPPPPLPPVCPGAWVSAATPPNPETGCSQDASEA